MYYNIPFFLPRLPRLVAPKDGTGVGPADRTGVKLFFYFTGAMLGVRPARLCLAVAGGCSMFIFFSKHWGSEVPWLNSLRSFFAKNLIPVPSDGATGQAGQAGFRGSGFKVPSTLKPLNRERLREIIIPYIPDLPRLPGTSMLYSGMDP